MASSSSDASTRWNPPPGRHSVYVGGSLGRALRARKGQPPMNKKTPVTDYYLFKYKFVPESVDTTKTGVVEVKPGKEASSIHVERPCIQSDDVHMYRGEEEPAKEVECVLIYDEQTNTFTLEKLDSSISLTHEGKGPSKVRPPSASPKPIDTPSPAPTLQAHTATEEEESVEDGFKAMDEILGKNKPKPAESLPPPPPLPSTLPKKPIRASPPRSTPLPPPPVTAPAASTPPTGSKSKPKPRLRTSAAGTQSDGKSPSPFIKASSKVLPPKPVATSSSSSSATAAATAAAVPPPPPASAPASTLAEPEVEELRFGMPARPSKRPRQASPPPTPAKASSGPGLALPTSGGAAFMPGPSTLLVMHVVEDDDDDDDNWDIVAGAGAPSVPEVAPAEEEELDVNMFAAELDQELLGGLEEVGEEEEEEDGDDIFGDAAYAAESPEASTQPKGKIKSMWELAGANDPSLEQQEQEPPQEQYEDEDDYSSSEESDDED